MATILNVQEIKILAAYSQTSEARLKLAEFLKFPKFDEDNNLRISIFLDYLFSILQQSLKWGCSCKEICWVMQFAIEIHLHFKDYLIDIASEIFKEKLNLYSVYFKPRLQLKLIAYFINTLFMHYSLYKYVFTQDQTSIKQKCEYSLQTLEPLMPFSSGKEYSLWNYEKRLKDLEIYFENCFEKRINFRRSADKIRQTNLLQICLETAPDSSQYLSKSELQNLISELIKENINYYEIIIKHIFEDSMDRLNYQIAIDLEPKPILTLAEPPTTKKNKKAKKKQK